MFIDGRHGVEGGRLWTSSGPPGPRRSVVCSRPSPAANEARASFTIDALVGGAPTGVSYVNFDNLPLGPCAGTSGGIGVSYSGTGQAVQGSSSGVYAAPFLSNSNGALFGDPTVSGPDATTYLTTGIGSVSLSLPGPEKYLGLLWGSVDSYNSLRSTTPRTT